LGRVRSSLTSTCMILGRVASRLAATRPAPAGANHACPSRPYPLANTLLSQFSSLTRQDNRPFPPARRAMPANVPLALRGGGVGERVLSTAHCRSVVTTSVVLPHQGHVPASVPLALRGRGVGERVLLTAPLMGRRYLALGLQPRASPHPFLPPLHPNFTPTTPHPPCQNKRSCPIIPLCPHPTLPPPFRARLPQHGREKPP
jgi:hypothetical protein